MSSYSRTYHYLHQAHQQREKSKSHCKTQVHKVSIKKICPNGFRLHNLYTCIVPFVYPKNV